MYEKEKSIVAGVLTAAVVALIIIISMPSDAKRISRMDCRNYEYVHYSKENGLSSYTDRFERSYSDSRICLDEHGNSVSKKNIVEASNNNSLPYLLNIK